LDGNLIGHDLANDIFDDLTIPNKAKSYAEKTNRWGWQDMPDDFQLGWLDGDVVVMPRGYALRLKHKLRARGRRVQWIDRRRRARRPQLAWRKEFAARPHQTTAVTSMTKHQQGIYEAPTGSGKTLACLMFIQAVRPARTLVLVEKLDLLSQWLREIGNWFGGEYAGQIGSGKWIDTKRITVATAQTLWRRFKTVDLSDPDIMAWFDSFDCVIVDECHHVSAATLEFIAGNFTAKWRFGVSATPDKQDDKYDIVRAVLGDVIHRDEEKKLRKAGVLVRPSVEVFDTQFSFFYWNDHESDEEGNCEVPGCKRMSFHRHSNNYQALKDRIVVDGRRNRIVINTILNGLRDGKHHHLVISDEIRHLEALWAMLLNELDREQIFPPTYMLTGQVNGKKRAAMVQEIKQQSEAIVFATIAKEGLDIPQIDRIYLPFPASNAKSTQQKIGRGTRSSNGKRETTIIDYRDRKVPLLRRQFRNRRVMCYDKLDIDVVFANS
jgi:superfamily II DNA or RNA helicase